MKNFFPTTLIVLCLISFSGVNNYVYAQVNQNDTQTSPQKTYWGGFVDGTRAFIGAIVDITNKYIYEPFIGPLIRNPETPPLAPRDTTGDNYVFNDPIYNGTNDPVYTAEDNQSPFKFKPPIKNGTNNPFPSPFDDSMINIAKYDVPLQLSDEEKRELIDAPKDQNTTKAPEIGTSEWQKKFNQGFESSFCDRNPNFFTCKWFEKPKEEILPPKSPDDSFDDLKDAPKDDDLDKALDDLDKETEDVLDEQEKLDEELLKDILPPEEYKDTDSFSTSSEEDAFGYEDCTVLVKFDKCRSDCAYNILDKSCGDVNNWTCWQQRNIDYNQCLESCGNHPGYCIK